MVSLKLTLVVLLAFGAVQCQSASVIEPESKELDVFLAVQEAIKVVRNIVAAVEKGIDDSKSSIDVLIKQLAPELGNAVRKIYKDVLELVKEEKKRIEFVIKEVEQLLDALKKIKKCTDPEQKDIDKALEKLENGALKAVRDTLKHHSEAVEDIKEGMRILLKEARDLVDKEIKNIIGCIKPGNPNAQKCIETEIDNIRKGVLNLGGKIVLFLKEIQDSVEVIAAELLEKATPLIDAFMKDTKPIIKKVSDCIAKMK